MLCAAESFGYRAGDETGPMVVACTLAHGHLSQDCEAEVAGDGTEKKESGGIRTARRGVTSLADREGGAGGW